MAIIFFVKGSGRVRAFAFAGALGGFYMYRKTLGRLVMAASDKIINFVKLIIKKIILPPLKVLKRVIMAVVARLKNALSALCRRIYLMIRRKTTKRYILAFAESALCGFGDKAPKTKENKRKRKK